MLSSIMAKASGSETTVKPCLLRNSWSLALKAGSWKIISVMVWFRPMSNQISTVQEASGS